MADRLVLVHDRLVVLHPAIAHPQLGVRKLAALLRGQRAFGLGRHDGGLGIERFAFRAMGIAALIEEEPRQLQVAPLARGAIQFDQGQLDLLVPVHVIALARAEDAVDVVGEPLGGVEHLGIAGQLGVRDGHLEEVARVVHLVLQAQVVPSLVLLLHDEIRDEEPVLLLGGQDAIEDAIHALAQLGVVEVLQGIHRAFQGLVQIRVEGVVAVERAVELARRLVEVGDVPVLLQTVQRVGDGHLVWVFRRGPQNPPRSSTCAWPTSSSPRSGGGSAGAARS